MTRKVWSGGAWVDISGDGGGGGGGVPLTLDNRTLHATYGDDFTGASLDSKWTRLNVLAGDETYQARGGSWLSFPGWLGKHVPQLTQTAPGGNFAITAKLSHSDFPRMCGVFVADAPGGGVAAATYDNLPNLYLIGLAGRTYSSTGPSTNIGNMNRAIHWVRLEKSGTTYTAKASVDGASWHVVTSTMTWSGTPTVIGFGSVYVNGGMSSTFGIDWFDLEVL